MPQGTVSLRKALAKSWKIPRHPRILLNSLSPFRISSKKSQRKQASSPSSNSSTALCRKRSKRRGLRSLLFLLQCHTRKPDDASETDKVGDLREFNRFSDKVYPSPVTPLYVKTMAKRRGTAAAAADQEDACRNFENYMVEMIVDDGKLGDLMEVEELLACWENLRCPVYMELVCRFYADMCNSVFSADNQVDYNE